MKRLLTVAMLVLMGLTLSAVAQVQRPKVRLQNVSQPGQDPDRQYSDRADRRGQRLSPEDQSKFDNYYQKWVNDQRKNDRDDVRKDEQHMQDIMARYNIPQDVPYERIASQGAGYGDHSQYGDRDDRREDRYGDRDHGYDRWRGRLSAEDQRRFDDAYAKWVNDTRKNDRDDIRSDEQHMQDIMARYNIPSDVPFDAIASQGRR